MFASLLQATYRITWQSICLRNASDARANDSLCIEHCVGSCGERSQPQKKRKYYVWKPRAALGKYCAPVFPPKHDELGKRVWVNMTQQSDSMGSTRTDGTSEPKGMTWRLYHWFRRRIWQVMEYKLTKNYIAIMNNSPGLYAGWAVRRLQDGRLHLPALRP